MKEIFHSERLEDTSNNPTVDIEFIEYSGVDESPTDEWLTRIKQRLASDEAFIDSGQSGKVYSINFRTCAKAIKVNPTDLVEANMRRFSNSPYQEAKIHFEINKLRSIGLNCPEFLAYLKGKDEDVLIIKRLNAIKLEDLISGKNKLSEIVSVEQIIDQMKQQMKILHENGFAHRDLESRNWMIEKNTGKVFMIDFGWAIALSDENREQAIAKDIKSTTDIFQSLTNNTSMLYNKN